MEIPTELIALLRRTGHLVVLTGAGISAESGVPTFREAQTGLWARFEPMELATPEAFEQDPQLVWEWYEWRRDLVARAVPNAGHIALAKMEEYFPQLTLVTQNVDGLHRLAGSRSVIELHGNIWRTKCARDGELVKQWADTGQKPPPCPRCGGPLRPDVVWFGESLSQLDLNRAFRAAKNCDLFLSIGTSSVVQPAASLPLAALRQGRPCVEINPQHTPLSDHMTYTLPGPAGQILPELLQLLEATG